MATMIFFGASVIVSMYLAYIWKTDTLTNTLFKMYFSMHWFTAAVLFIRMAGWV